MGVLWEYSLQEGRLKLAQIPRLHKQQVAHASIGWSAGLFRLLHAYPAGSPSDRKVSLGLQEKKRKTKCGPSCELTRGRLKIKTGVSKLVQFFSE